MGAGSYKACSSVLLALLLSGSTYAGVHEATASKTKLKYENNVRANVTGTVKDSKGEPLPGVSVKIKGTTTGTTTDVNGVFRLNLPTGNETLVFSFLGFRTLEVAAKGQATLNVTLAEDAKALEEVVVVGYGTQKKAHLTGSVVDIKASELEDLPVTNVATALSGRLLGVGVSGGISRPGNPASLTVRNPNTIFSKDGGSPQPLFVIDDVIQVDGQGKPDNTLFNSLTPVEIESISILKDAAAAIYGSRGGNGVVLVKTKRGKSGKPKITYSGSYAINDAAYRTKMMSAYQFGMYMNIMNGPNGANALPTSATYKNAVFSADELEHFKTLNYNWVDDAWSSSYNTQHNVSLSGGSENATYFANISYNKQNGNLSTLDFDRWNFRAGTDVKIASYLKAGLQVSGNASQMIKTFNKVGSEDDEDDYQNLLTAAPYVPMYINGMPVKFPGTTNDLSRYHFYEIQRLGNLSDTEYKFYTVNLYGEYEAPFLKGLKARASYGRNMSSSNNQQIGTKYNLYQFTGLGDHGHIYEGATNNGILSVSNGNRLWYSNINSTSIQANFSLSYSKTIKDHSFSGLFSLEKSESENEQEDVQKSDPIQSTNGQFNTAFGTFDGRSFANEAGSLGYIGRINYAYKNKYLGEFLFRTDASTKFAPANYWGRFYSTSLGWVVSEESFFKVPFIDFLKLRYSFGKLGNDQTKAWVWRQRYTPQDGKGGVFGGNSGSTTGIKMEVSPNPDATWSNEYKNNLGIDAKFLNSRLSTTIEGYFNAARDILKEKTGAVPVTIGGSVASQNFASANYFGTELEIGWNDNIGKDLRYGISTRLSWNDDKVLVSDFNETDLLKPWNARPGQSSDNGVWGYDYLGMFKNQDEVNAYVQQYNITQVFGTAASQLRPGTLYYRDVRGALQPDGTFAGPDGIINENDQIQLAKKAASHYNFGITLKAGYKGLNVDAVIGGSFGGWDEVGERSKLNNSIDRNFTSLPVIWGNIYDPVLNPTGTMPNPNFSDISLSPTSNFWKVNAFRMRMTSFNINYTIPTKIVNKLKISSARVFFSGLNPMNFYNPYSYKDAYGSSWDAYPALRTYSFGMNVTL